MTLGEKIARFADLQAITYRELAETAEVPYSTLVSCANRGANRMKDEYIRRIAGALHVDYDYLSGRKADSETDALLGDGQPFVFKLRTRKLLDKLDPEIAEELCSALPSYGSDLTMEEILDANHEITPQDVTAVSRLLGVSSFYLLGLINTPTMSSGAVEQAAAMRGSDVLKYSQEVKDNLDIALQTLQETALSICYLPDTPDDEKETEADRVPGRLMELVRFLNANKDMLRRLMS